MRRCTDSEYSLNWEPLVARMGNSMEASQGSS
ncbi:unnamed protein product [Ectocarpus sp. CCAP 1310/34]|nr:unnamed protein product [Ectocarpus sp. CCAP 1310/34]